MKIKAVKRAHFKPTHCLATLPNVATVCGAPIADTSGAVCHACRERIHRTMQASLYRYGDFKLADELDAHYRAYHAPDTKGFSCPQCFFSGHKKALAGHKKTRYDFLTVE